MSDVKATEMEEGEPPPWEFAPSLMIFVVTAVTLGFVDLALSAWFYSNYVEAELSEVGIIILSVGTVAGSTVWLLTLVFEFAVWSVAGRRAGRKFTPGKLRELSLVFLANGRTFSLFWALMAIVMFGVVAWATKHPVAETGVFDRYNSEAVTSLAGAFGIGVSYGLIRFVAWFKARRIGLVHFATYGVIGFWFVFFEIATFAQTRIWIPAVALVFGFGLVATWSFAPYRKTTRRRVARFVIGACWGLSIALGGTDLFRGSSYSQWITYTSIGPGFWFVVNFATDFDADGYGSYWAGGDCAPFDSSVYPGALEIVGDSIDNNCSGSDLTAFTPTELTPEPLGFGGGIRNEEIVDRHNVIFITIDTLRADAFYYSLSRGEFPRIIQLLSDSITAERAYVTAPHTNETVVSLMTGTYPVHWHQLGVFYGTEPTLAEVLSHHRYTTSAVVALPFNIPNAWRGFDRMDDSLVDFIGTDMEKIVDDQVREAAVDELSTIQDQDFLLWVHFYDPHAAYVPTPEEVDKVKGSRDPRTPQVRYSAEVYRTLGEVEALLSALHDRGLYDDSIVILASEHGEGLGNHRVLTHGYTLFESTMLVPMALKIPGLGGRRIESPISVVDVVPTVLDALGLEGLESREGVSLISEPELEGRLIFGESNYETQGPPLGRMVIRDEHKLIWDMRRNAYHLFDVENDPGELNNLIDEEPELFEELLGELHRYFDSRFNDQFLRAKTRQWDWRKLPE